MADQTNQTSAPVDTAKRSEDKPVDTDQYTLEQLVLLVTSERLHNIEDRCANELKELSERQDRVRKLHDLLAKINALTDASGKVKVDEELRKMLEAAKADGIDIEIKDIGQDYDPRGRERLIDNIRMRADDLNVKNDMQIQTISRLTNERYESYQLARSILKPLHDDKLNKARAARGN